MKIPKQPFQPPNPGIENDNRGRLLIIFVILAGIGYWIYTSLGGWENVWDEFTTEIKKEFGIELSDEYPEPDPQAVQVMPVKFKILRESRKDIIKKLKEEGQEDKISIFLEALDKFEET